MDLAQWLNHEAVNGPCSSSKEEIVKARRALEGDKSAGSVSLQRRWARLAEETRSRRSARN